jgi:hypothetical protein
MQHDVTRSILSKKALKKGLFFRLAVFTHTPCEPLTSCITPWFWGTFEGIVRFDIVQYP